MKRSIKALAVAAPLVALSGWLIAHNGPASPNSASNQSFWGETEEVEAGRLRPLPAGPPMYAPGTFAESVPPAERIGDMMLEVIPDSAGLQRHPADTTANHDFTGNAI
jgi:hypothetical protein